MTKEQKEAMDIIKNTIKERDDLVEEYNKLSADFEKPKPKTSEGGQ